MSETAHSRSAAYYVAARAIFQLLPASTYRSRMNLNSDLISYGNCSAQPARMSFIRPAILDLTHF